MLDLCYNMRPLIFYHKDCSDGFGSAWAAWKHFGDAADYRALSNGEPTPIAELTGRETYFLDIAAKPEAITQTKEQAKKLTVIDHHGTNKDAAENAHEGIFALDHSGSVLTWQYFHKAKPMPKLLLFIEDVDLWRFTLPQTKHISMSLSLIPRQFSDWSDYAELLENEDGLRKEDEKGRYLLAFSDQEIAVVSKEAELVNFEGYKVLMVNSPSIFASAMGHLLAKRTPPLALVWSRKNGQYKVSLRSDKSVNVAELAQKYGGGGHPGAAAFIVKTADWPTFMNKLLNNR